MRKKLLSSDIFRGSVYGAHHPLNIARVWPAIDICRAEGWLSDDEYQPVLPMPPTQLAQFHDPDYVAQLALAQRHQTLPEEARRQFQIGQGVNPIFPEVYDRPATAAQASHEGALLLLEGAYDIVYNPAGGTHHGRYNKAHGFCFVNDPVIALLTFLRQSSAPVLYIDIDAHHADGVQDWLSHEAQLRLISIHQGSAWPRTGASDDRGAGSARNYTLEDGAGDEALLALLTTKVTKEIDAFDPTYMIIQAGADGHRDDPQSKLNYSLSGYWQAIDFILSYQKPTLILGGGGYNPYITACAWAGIWAMLQGVNVEKAILSSASQSLLRNLTWTHRMGQHPPEHWFTHLGDGI